MNIHSLFENRLLLKERGRNVTSETARQPQALCGQSFRANTGLCRAKPPKRPRGRGQLLQQGTLQGSPSLHTTTLWQILSRKYQNLARRAHPSGDTRCLVSAREHLQTLATALLVPSCCSEMSHQLRAARLSPISIDNSRGQLRGGTVFVETRPKIQVLL